MKYNYLFFNTSKDARTCCLACGEERLKTIVSKVTVTNSDEPLNVERKEFSLAVCKQCIKTGGTITHRIFRRILNLQRDPHKCYF